MSTIATKPGRFVTSDRASGRFAVTMIAGSV
jgi:hypothetical protein